MLLVMLMQCMVKKTYCLIHFVVMYKAVFNLSSVLLQWKKQYGPNREAGEKFLEENAKKEGVVVLPSGVQYKVIKKGRGKMPKVTDKVEVAYEGTLIDGTVFDSSYKRKKDAEFGVGQVIPGWTEVLQLMPVGSTYMVYIPQDKAYVHAKLVVLSSLILHWFSK